MKIDPYNPLDLEALGDSLLRRLEGNKAVRIDQLDKFDGSGIYALYYTGQADPYAVLGEHNRKGKKPIPLYVGRAKDSGARRGVSPLLPVDEPLLWSRVREHQRSIGHAANLKVEDFAVRVLVVMPVWIPLAEAVVIRTYRPLWNSHVQGFGIHAPGGGRTGQAKSEWDVLHAGRAFAAGLTGAKRQPANRADLLERTRRLCAEAVADQRKR